MKENVSNIEMAFINYLNLGNEDRLKHSTRTSLKKTYSTFRREKRADESLNISNLNKIIKLLLDNYDELKNINEINEILQLIIDDIKFVQENEYEDRNENIIKEIYVAILGNPGTTSKGLSVEEIEDIIKRKIQDVDELLINRDDILNILKEQSVPAVYGVFDRYQKLIEDVIMDSVENNLEAITNPKAIDVLKELAISYKNQGNYEKSKEIYEKCLELYNKIERDSSAIKYEFSELLNENEEEKTIEPAIEPENPKDEEQRLKDELENITDISNKINELLKDVSNNSEEDLTQRFLSLKVSCLEELIRGLNGEVELEEVTKNNFREHNPIIPNPNPDNDSLSRKNYVMPVHEKVEGIQRAIGKLGLTIEKISVFRTIEENKNSEIIRLAQETIKDYSEFVLIRLKELNISLLECLSTDQRYLQIIPNEKLFEILQFEKVRDQKLSGTINKKHTEGTFANNLTQTLEKILDCRRQGKPIKNEELGDKLEGEENSNQQNNNENLVILIHKLEVILEQLNFSVKEYIKIKAESHDLKQEKEKIEELIKQKNEIQNEIDKLK